MHNKRKCLLKEGGKITSSNIEGFDSNGMVLCGGILSIGY